jgi:hypothetical protein
MRSLRLGRRRRRGVGRLQILSVAAGSASAALLGGELAHLARSRSTPAEAVVVLREGYRAGPANEASLLNLFLSFGLTFAGARVATRLIRSGRGPLRNVRVGRRHIHHFVPGILLSLLSGAASIALRHENLDHWLAVPFGAGAALVLDEAALLLELEDVYWSEEAVVSVEIALGTLALLASMALVVRIARRGEQRLPPAATA